MTKLIQQILEPRQRDLGGFTVRRVLPAGECPTLGPFVFFDEMGPTTFAAGQGVDVRPHPHIGLATVTWLFEGELLHRDSLGCVQGIQPGAVNWMTAGRGIVHSERTPPAVREAPARLHGIQSWVALPRDSEECPPEFHHYPAESLPRRRADGVDIRLIAGSLFGMTAPVRICSPMGYADLSLSPGNRLTLDADYPERALYPVSGELQVGDTRLLPGQFAVLVAGAAVEIAARAATRVMLVSGEPVDGARHLWWNFVSSSEERIAEARAAWREHRFPPVPGESEFIPLPER